jgi:lantibiotic modifying enzyme
VAWCHGAPGIGLARIDNLRYFNDRETRSEIDFALEKIVATPFGRDPCLCHGDLGNLDILFEAGRRFDPSWWDGPGRKLADETMAAVTDEWYVTRQSGMRSPGLMVGLSGVGYGLLRLACPDQVPSILTLAPPF